MLVDDGAGVAVIPLPVDDDFALTWRAMLADEVLRLGLYRGSVEELELEVEGGQLRLEPAGDPVPPPTSAFLVGGDGELRTDTPQGWPARRRVPRRECEPMQIAITWTPTHAITFHDMVPSLTGAVVAVATIAETKQAILIDGTQIKPLFPAARGAFQGLDGAPWIILPEAMVRLDAADAVVERVEATGLRIFAAAEAPSGPRFVMINWQGEVMRWDGVGAPVPLDGPTHHFNYSARYDFKVLTGGDIWLATSGWFAHYRQGIGWDLDEAPLSESEAFGSRLVRTHDLGTILSVRFYDPDAPDARVIVQWYRRLEPAWVPLVGPGVLSAVEAVEHDGVILGISKSGVVEVDVGVAERGVSTCAVAEIVPDRLVSTPRGVLFVGDFSLGWLRAR